MRIANRSHIPWFLFVAIATAAAGWIYLGNFSPARLPAGLRLPPALIQTPSEHHSIGGTPVGLIFGTIAFGIFIFGILLSLRKRIVLWPIGSVQSWMRAHIWLTLLTIPLVLFHSGFRLGAPMTTTLMLLYAVVMVSGIYGLALQHRIPRVMQDRLPREIIYEQIPHVRSQLLLAAQKLCRSLRLAVSLPAVAGPSPPNEGPAPVSDRDSELALITFLEDQVLPYLKARSGNRFRFGSSEFAADAFRFVRLRVADSYYDRVEQIQGWCDQRRLLDLQTKLHRWLHNWLFVHVPFSFLLVILTAWHAFVTLFYY